MIEWTCLGPGPQHQADIRWVETVGRLGHTPVKIDRCRTCGQLYRYTSSEINDWGRGGDRCDETFVWETLAADEVPALRADPGYTPKAGTRFMHQTGWH